MQKPLVTFTSSVSDLTYRGHPSIDDNFVDCSPRMVPVPGARHHWRSEHTDPIKALKHLKALMESLNQPVTWIINDNEYLNNNGTLPLLLDYQSRGDSIMITFEITQRPSPVNRKDTQAVLMYAEEQCRLAGLRIDGVWSLKFYQSDIAALKTLSEKFSWAKNIAGACWLQEGHVDDSGWRGCPFGAYYVADNNIKGVKQCPTNNDIVMMHWLSRDFATALLLDRVEAYGLDPADPARICVGGFGNETAAGHYMGQLANQIISNDNMPNILRIHEETRMYFDEGHDKDVIIKRLYDEIEDDKVQKTTLNKAYEVYRKENPTGENRFVYSGKGLDERFPKVSAMLYEDGKCQMHFLETIGAYPLRMYDYTFNAEDSGGNYPLSMFPIIPFETVENENQMEITFDITEDMCRIGQYAIAIWDRPDLIESDNNQSLFKHLKTHDNNHLVIFKPRKGKHKFVIIRG